AKWLLFTDADTQHALGSLRKSLSEAQQNNLVLLSYSPKQKVVTFWEKILQPIVFAELNHSFRYEEVSDSSSEVAAANGQYLLVRRDAYERAGGHAAVKGSLLDDVDLARRLKRQGPIRFRYSPESVEARMYTNFAEIASNPSAQNQATIAEVTPTLSFGSARSSGLWLQIFGVERFSFLPNVQSDGRDLARQGQPRQLGLYPLPQKVFVEEAKGAVTATGGGGRTLKQVLQIVVVIQVEAANEHRLVSALQLPVHHLIVGAAARLQRQPAVGPELSLAAEAMGRLHPPEEQGDAYRTEPGNGAQQLGLVMLATLQNQIVAGLAAQLLQQVEFLVKSLGATA